MNEEAAEKARELAEASLKKGDATSWFEDLYAQAGGNPDGVPWADLAPHPALADWLSAGDIQGHGRRTLVVGCGLGDDAEALAARGFDVTAFDISPSAVEWARKRFPGSSVAYHVADLFELPAQWQAAFDFVAEVYTFQSLPPHLRPDAMTAAARMVSPGGDMLLVCRAREPEDPTSGPPWPLATTDLAPLVDAGLEETRFHDFVDDETPPVRRFLVEYRRPPE